MKRVKIKLVSHRKKGFITAYGHGQTILWMSLALAYMFLIFVDSRPKKDFEDCGSIHPMYTCISKTCRLILDFNIFQCTL